MKRTLAFTLCVLTIISQSPETALAADPPAAAPAHLSLVSVKNFHAMPMEGFPGDDMQDFKITSHQVAEGQVVLDFQFLATFVSLNANGGLKSALNKTFAGAAAFAPDTGRWLVAVMPDPITLEMRNAFPHHSTLWHGDLYCSNNGRILKFDAQKHAWVTNALAVDGNCQLINLEGHLYTADNNTIQEITDDGRHTKLLASLRRQPPVSLLDTQGALRNLVLFLDASHRLRAGVHDRIYTWTGNDWQQGGAAPAALYPESFADGVLFRSFPGGSSGSAQITRQLVSSEKPDVCFLENGMSVSGLARRMTNGVSNRPILPPWSIPTTSPDSFVFGLCAALQKSNLYLLVDHSEMNRMAGNSGTREDVLPKDGYHAELSRYSSGQLLPKKVGLKFEDQEGCAPLAGMNPGPWPMQAQLPASWLLFAGNQLCFGVQKPVLKDSPDSDFEHMPGEGHPPGIWTIPADEIEKAYSSEATRQ